VSRIQARFENLRKSGRKALIPYITAGDPAPAMTVPLLRALVESGADILELGVPFSDPMADGPVVQRSGERALKHGVGMHHVLDMAREFRHQNSQTPLVLMGYANPIEAMGVEAFVRAAAAAGVDGVIVVDYPPEECTQFAALCKASGIDPVFLLAPTSTDRRIQEVARVGSGYLYYVSLRGVTGGRPSRLRRRRGPHPEDPGGDAPADRRGLRHPRRRVRAQGRERGRRGGHRQPHHPGNRGRRARARHRARSGPLAADPGGARRMSWLQKLLPPKIQRSSGPKRAVPEGLWTKCPACDAVLYSTDLEKNLNVCPKCGFHQRIGARARLEALLDVDARFEIGAEVQPMDSLKFRDSKRYTERLLEAEAESGESEALIVMQGAIKSQGVVVAVHEFEFMAGTMGSVLGERFVRGVRVAIEQKLPFIAITASGGARMQEGLLSLMQMAKTTAALTDLAERGLPFVTVLTDPTTGGVSASYAMIGDVVIAEPKALVGFAGPRVIEQTVRQKLPEGFQRAEFLLEKGAVDMIIDRRQLRDKLATLLALLQGIAVDQPS
jgi:acetyl-CoA carboxylase carboxyl transferase subunit beta